MGGRMSQFSIRTQPFRLGLADYRALWLAEVGRVFLNLPLFLIAVYSLVGLPVLWTLSDLLDGRIRSYLYAQAAWLVVEGGLLLGVALSQWRRYRHDPVMTGERIMVLDAGAVRLIGYGFDARQAWAAFAQVRQGRDHLFIYMRSHQAYIVPKRALASPEDAARLVSNARDAIRAARQAPAVLPPLPEAPDNREIWRSRPYRRTFILAFPQVLSRLWPIALLAIGMVALCAAADVWLKGLDNPAPLFALATVAGMVLVLPVAGTFLSWLVVRNRPELRGDRETVFTRDHVRFTSAAIDSRTDWANVRKVYRIRGAVVFRLGTNGRIDVPLSAFDTPAQAMAYFTQAVAFWRAAQARR